MNGESYETMDLYEMDTSYEAEGAEYESGEIDEMLEAMMDSAEAGEFAERRRRRRQRQQQARRQPVPTAQGRPAYRTPSPAASGFVTQTQLKEALDRVGIDVRRNAEGIKTINTRLGALNGRVDGVVTVATRHSRGIGKLESQMKIDGALELVEALNMGQLNAFQLLKGAAKSGFLGDGKGPLGNPLVIGGVGLLLRNPNILGGLVGAQPVP